MNEAQIRAVRAVAEAWTKEGSNPRFHRDQQDRLRTNMPILAAALDKLVDTLPKY